MDDTQKKYPEGHFLAIGMALGIPLGMVFATALENPGFIGIGLPFGLATGLALEAKYKKEGKIRPLTKEELKARQIWVIAGIVLLVLGIFVFWLFL
jgi:polyferredoxin